jgi:hypothetical protein
MLVVYFDIEFDCGLSANTCFFFLLCFISGMRFKVDTLVNMLIVVFGLWHSLVLEVATYRNTWYHNPKDHNSHSFLTF